MSPVRARPLAWGLAILAIAMMIGSYVVVLAFEVSDALAFFSLAGSVFEVVLAALGALIASRHPRNAIGWIFLGVALSRGLFDLTYALVERELQGDGDPGPLVRTTAACVNVGWIPSIFVPATFLLLLFPDGRLPSRRWRLVAWCAGAGIVGFLLSYGTEAGPLDNFHDVENPFGVASSVTGPLYGLTALALVVGLLGSVASIIRRFRRAGHVQRQQIKWLAIAGAVAIVAVAFRGAAEGVLGSDVSNSVLLLALLGLPVSVGIAILRHRLYDIDVVINRTLVYGALTATLAGTYLAGVLLLQLALNPLTASNSLAIAVSTLAVAALFRPARRRIQATVDRRFYRRKYDAARTLERFGVELRNEVELGALASELRRVVTDTMQPTHVSLWLRAPQTDRLRNDSRTALA